MRRRLVVLAVCLVLVSLVWLVFGMSDRGGVVRERALETDVIEVASEAGDEELIRAPARRTPRREERPVVPEVAEDVAREGFFVVCEVEGPPPGTDGYLMFPEGRGSRVSVAESRIGARVPPGVTQARLVLDGYGPADVTLVPGDPGQCRDIVRFESGPAVVNGMVTHADGRPAGKVWVQGCGRRVLTDVDGSYYLEAISQGACQVQAFRQDGVFTIWSTQVTVQPVSGQDTAADLALPPYTTAGLGAEVRNVDQGVLIMRTLEGSAAQLAGLQQGDVVLEIDGVPTVDLSLSEFVERALGPQGTDVELVVAEGEDGERVVELQRQIVERDEG